MRSAEERSRPRLLRRPSRRRRDGGRGEGALPLEVVLEGARFGLDRRAASRSGWLGAGR